MNFNVSRIINHPLRVPIGVGVISFGVGLGAGYILAKKKDSNVEVFDEPKAQMEFDWSDMDSFMNTQLTNGPEPVNDVLQDYAIPDEPEAEEFDPVEIGAEFAAQQLEKAMTTPVEPEPVRSTIFAGTDDEWNYEAEVAKRSPSEPYVIHKDEFYGEESGFPQTTLTYYTQDDIMVDEEDVPVYNHNTVVGALMFGHGSGDANVFYVRNEKRKAEYEIIQDSGAYSREVLGLEIEDNERVKGLKHSNTPRKFKPDD